MKHYDQNTIELFVLGSLKVVEVREELEQHLKECYTCRSLAEELAQFYQMVGGRQPLLAERAEGDKDDSLVIRPEYRPAYRDRGSIPIRMWGRARAHPVASSILSVGTLALILWAWNMVSHSGGVLPANDLANPEGFHYNQSTNNLEVYNSRDEILWTKSSRALNEIEEAELSFKSTFTAVQDLDGDGVNEVITLIPVVLPDGKLVRNSVRIFNHEGTLLSSTRLGESVAFGNRQYDQNAFGSGGLVVVGRRAGARNIVAVAPHWRSPTVVARLSARGEILGEFWHYGHICGIYKVRLRDNGKECVVLIGGDDSRDSVGVRFPVLIVLDPDGLVGKTESPATRGFGFAVSKAEIAHLWFPITEADKALESQPYILWVTSSDEGFLHVAVQTGKPADIGRSSAVEYVLDQKFRVSAVHPIEDPYNTLAQLYKKGLTRQLPDSAYFARLKDSVKYR